MATITTLTGDTFALISRRVYGTEQKAGIIAAANPGITSPMVQGVEVTVPTAPAAATNTSADDPDELVVTISGTRFRWWTGVSLTRSIDAMDALTITAPFEPDDAAFRAAFRPFSYAPVGISVGGTALFTGTMLAPEPRVQEKSRVVVATCYSAPAVLGDCTAPASMYPLEWDSVGLRAIAATLAEPFGLSVQFDADPGAVFPRVSLGTGDKVLPFLAKLAQQRGLLTSSTADGKLLFTKSVDAGSPVARLSEGSFPLLSVTPAFNAQEYYSGITAIEPAFVGLKGSAVTVQNTRLKGVVRPYTFTVQDTLDADVQAACEGKAGRMFAGAISYTLQVATWRTPLGELWAPNTTITLYAPGEMIYTEYEFLIRAVAFSRTSDDGSVASLTLTVPGAFAGTIPEALPWD